MEGGKFLSAVYVDITLSLSKFTAWVRAVGSAFWADVPGGSAWVQRISSRVTPAAPASCCSPP